MESIPMEMDDIFGEDEDAEDFNPSRLPDLEDELEPMRDLRDGNESADDAGNDEPETDNAELLAKLKSMKGASKHTARKAVPKLDAARLTGERGIPALPKVFANVEFQGKNHEAEDLKLMMRHLEHWAHRLFPKMPFAEVLERVERLGAKKDVQTCVKKIRLDLPVLTSDHVEDDEDEVQRSGDADEEDNVRRAGHSSGGNEIDEEEIEELLRDQEMSMNVQDDEQDIGFTKKTPSKPENVITDEMKARIEHNKKLAMERRAAKLAQNTQETNDIPTLPGPASHEISSAPAKTFDDVSIGENSPPAKTFDDVSIGENSPPAKTFDNVSGGETSPPAKTFDDISGGETESRNTVQDISTSPGDVDR